MTRKELKRRLVEEMDKYAKKLTYEEAAALAVPIAEQRGTIAPNSSGFYQVTVRLLEKVTLERDDYINLMVSVDDGRGPGIGPFRVIAPETGSLIVHRDGRIEKCFRD